MASRLSASLRVVTINTWKGDGPYGRRIEVLAEQLAALKPDVVACQEVLQSNDGTLSTVDTLAAALGVEAHSAPARAKERTVEGMRMDCTSGLAVFSRWPPTGSQTIALPSDPEDGERIAQLLTLDTPGGEVLIANTHLTHLPARDDLRRAQLETVLGALASPRPIVSRLLCGDLNARPGSPAIAYLEDGDHRWEARDAGGCGGTAEGWATLSDRNPYVRKGIGEHVVDYIWSLDRPGDCQTTVTDARIVLDSAAENGVFPSDHFGVMATFELG